MKKVIYTDGSHLKHTSGRLGIGGLLTEDSKKEIDSFSIEVSTQDLKNEFGTSDVREFALVDGDEIYRFRSSILLKFNDLFEKGDLDWEKAFKYIVDNGEPFGSLKEITDSLDEAKKRQDEYNAMSPKEKEEYKKEWRRRRDENIAKMKEQNKEQ